MSSQAIFTGMKEVVAFIGGWDRTVANWSTDRTNLFEVLKKEALSRFENAYNWSFLYKLATLELVPSYTTGTIAIASGVVTGTGTVFPSWAAEGDLWVTDDSEMRQYTVASRGGDTAITLDDLTVNVSAGATYTLRRQFYNLPTDFGGTVDKGFAFRRDSIYAGRAIQKLGHADFQMMDSEVGGTSGVPCYYFLQTIPVTATASTTWRVAFTPLPGDTMFLDYRYKIIAADVDTTNDYPYGGANHSETILASLKYSAALYFEKPNSQELYFEYQQKLRDSIRQEQHYRPIDYGPGRHGYERGSARPGSAAIDAAPLFT